MNRPEVFIVSAVRTAIGKFGGSLKDVPPSQLASLVSQAALQRAGSHPTRVDQVIFGNVIPTVPEDAYLSRLAALNAGIPETATAYNVNRLCGSGLQAIVNAVQLIQLGDAEVALAGGVESMSRGPYMLPAARWGARMGDMQAIDYMLGVLHDPKHGIHMGVTAENIATRYGISREQQDALALQSYQRAARALAQGRFADQIVPVELQTRKGSQLFTVDEYVQSDMCMAQLAQMKPAFKKDGSVTAGNSSGLNDGASALLLASAEAVSRDGLTPMARLVAYAHSGVEPTLMGLGPIPATRLALQRAGLSVKDLDVIESNEAFAAQACAVAQELDFDPEKVNPNGSGISLGHPIGATGAIIATKAIHELHRTKGRYALVTMCIGGGQGIAVILERI
jgi:acetyl-CoA C-acetyltransferase